MDNTRFTGVWNLISNEFHFSDGEIKLPQGKQPSGILIYSGRYMSVQCMDVSSPLFSRQSNPAEEKSPYEGYIGYYGTYEVDEKSSVVTHHLIGSSFPDWINLSFPRSFKLSGNQLVLSSRDKSIDGRDVTILMIWERLE